MAASMEGLAVHPLARTDFRLAFPLVQAAVPTLDLRGWLRFAHRVGCPERPERSGIMAARRSARPHPVGLFCYHRARSLECASVLIADCFIVIDIIDHRPVMRALLAAFEHLGETVDCPIVRTVIGAGSVEIAGSLLAAGYRREAAMFCKSLPGAKTAYIR